MINLVIRTIKNLAIKKRITQETKYADRGTKKVKKTTNARTNWGKFRKTSSRKREKIRIVIIKRVGTFTKIGIDTSRKAQGLGITEIKVHWETITSFSTSGERNVAKSRDF